MAENSKIEWTDHTVNLWWGCVKISVGCRNCYAEKISNRFGDDIWGEDKPRKIIKSAFDDLAKYQRRAEIENKTVKVFMGSMMDIFELSKPLIGFRPEYVTTFNVREMLFDNIEAGKYQNIIFLFLTKRPENISDMVPYEWGLVAPENVWFGTSISDEETKINAITLRRSVVGNKFLSIEPQIGPIDELDLNGIKWVIQGGESGHHKRPFKISWAERMRDICKEQGVPYFFKQIDKVQPIPSDLMIKEYPDW